MGYLYGSFGDLIDKTTFVVQVKKINKIKIAEWFGRTLNVEKHRIFIYK